ncbi:MAG: enoyl-CoA hydratase/isomerase family protein [Chloroflexi bacterium]|nr:enoyl-CoA hydratase/isomerase family protein [Chloroflexota bacterium]
MPFVHYDQQSPQIAVITMNRPERLNAWGSEMARDLEEAFCRFHDDPQARVAILRGAGRAFCAGVDVKEWAETGQAPAWGTDFRRVFTGPGNVPPLTKPVIGAAHGYCIGAGVNLLFLRCDIRVCGESTRFAMPEVARGIMDLSTPFAFENIPTCFLSELFYTADYVDAQRAYHFGMVNYVVPDDQVLLKALDLAERIAQHPLPALQATKQNLLSAMQPRDGAFVLEELLRQRGFAAPDAVEGMRAFAEKRPPRWQGS